MMTVDWSNWLNLTPAQQNAVWARYRAIVKAESLALRPITGLPRTPRELEAIQRGIEAAGGA
jgi:predicted Fe-S protein YdhL (DUF1289 family)